MGVTGGVVEEVARGLEGVWTERGGCFMVLVSGIWLSILFSYCLSSMDDVEINWRINAIMVARLDNSRRRYNEVALNG